MYENRREIMQDVFLTYLPARKFKTSRLTVNLITGLERAGASANALLPAVLSRGTVRHPDMESLSAAMDTLYGATVDSVVRKKGERQCIGFAADFIDDAFTPHGERLLEPVAELMGEMLLEPLTRNGSFLAEYVDSEKANLIDAIRSLRNDKRDWAEIRLMQEMCAGEPYSILRLGDEETAAKLNNHCLYRHSSTLLAGSRVEVLYCGSAERQRVEDAVLSALAALPRGAAASLPPVEQLPPRETPRVVTEVMDVNQGKLALGYRCTTEDVPAMILANLIFGGTSNSKLFMNVREKLSLCYYASSAYHRQKRLITVSSGIEFQNYQKAYDEIMAQLAAVQAGRLEDWELEGARSTLLNAYASMGDSQGKLENFYLGQAATGQEDTPELLAEQVRHVTAERIFDAMQTVSLDTVYFLKGKETAE